jgi:hypothetical protein
MIESMQSQTFFIDDKAYPKSETGYLVGTYDNQNQSLEVFFFKQREINHIVFGTSFWMQEIKVIGNVKLYLNDNTVVNLIDRHQTDCAGNTCYSVYNLTKDEINKLKASNISMMRFKTSGTFTQTDKIAYNETDKPYHDGMRSNNKSDEKKTPTDFPAIVTKYFSDK